MRNQSPRLGSTQKPYPANHATILAGLVAVKMMFLALRQQNPCGTLVFGPPARDPSTKVLILGTALTASRSFLLQATQ